MNHDNIETTPPAPPVDQIPRMPADWVKALGQLAEPVKGGKVNAGQRRYTYLTLPDLLEAVRPVFATHNLAFTQSVWRDGDYAVCTTTVWHTNGWSHTTEPLVNRCSPGIQDLGSASTYLRRYSLATLVGLAGSEDDDGQRAQHGSAPTAKKTAGAPAPEGTNADSLPPVDPETGEILEPPATGKPKGFTKPTDPVSKPQLGMIHNLLKEQGITDRAEALQLLASLARLDGELKSSKDLTIAQGSMVISELQALTKAKTDG